MISDIEKYDKIDISLVHSFLKNEIKFNKNDECQNDNDKNLSTSDDESQLDKICHSKFSSKVTDSRDDFFLDNEKANNLKVQIF